MRKYIDIINESNQIVDENCVEHDAIVKGTWTEWQDRDGIYVVRPGSNSVYAGFCEQPEAEEYARNLGPEWKVIRWGRYKTLTDEEAKADYDIRRDRIRYGFRVEPITQDD